MESPATTISIFSNPLRRSVRSSNFRSSCSSTTSKKLSKSSVSVALFCRRGIPEKQIAVTRATYNEINWHVMRWGKALRNLNLENGPSIVGLEKSTNEASLIDYRTFPIYHNGQSIERVYQFAYFDVKRNITHSITLEVWSFCQLMFVIRHPGWHNVWRKTSSAGGNNRVD